MVNFNRRDRLADPAENANTVLKPAVYEPPGSANPGGGTSRASTGALQPSDPAGVRSPSQPRPPASSLSATKAPVADGPESKLFVGVNIKLKGVEITDCDALVIEGQV